jgi:hypothetical protein
VGVVGSHSAVPAAAGPLVARLVAAVAAAGGSVAVGCAAGVDQLALSASLACGAPLSVFCAGGPRGGGFWSGSAPLSLLRSAAAAGASVAWWAGGPSSVGLPSRLRGRAAALLSCVAFRRGLVVGLVHGGWRASPGSWRALRLAAGRGLPVVVFPLGAFPLPALGAGSWAPCAAGPLWGGAWRWVPAARAGVACLFCGGVGVCACLDVPVLLPELADRLTRALDEGPDYHWSLEPGVPRALRCRNPHSRNPDAPDGYRVTAAECSCPDWKAMRELNLTCKHQLALVLTSQYPHMLWPCPDLPDVARTPAHDALPLAA